MALTKPKKAASTEKSPRVWVPKASVSLWQGAVAGRYPSGANQGFIDNIGADPSLIVVGVVRNNCGAIPAGHVAAFGAEAIVDEIIQPMDFSQNSDCSTALRGAIVYGIDESKASMSDLDGPPIGVLWECDSATSGRVAIGPSFLAAAMESLDKPIVGTPLTDAGSTSIVRKGRHTWVTLPALPLTAARSYALPSLATSLPGDKVSVTRLDTSANTAAFTDSGSGTATLLTMPVSKVNAATFILNEAGTHWLLFSCGVQ